MDEIVGAVLALPTLINGIIGQGMASRSPTQPNIEVYTAAARLGIIAADETQIAKSKNAAASSVLDVNVVA
jgi:hypothetical protein